MAKVFLEKIELYKANKKIRTNGKAIHPPLAKESRLAKIPNIPEMITNTASFVLFISNK